MLLSSSLLSSVSLLGFYLGVKIAHKPISVRNFLLHPNPLIVAEEFFLVGGFAASDCLYNRVKEELEPRGLGVYWPDT